MKLTNKKKEEILKIYGTWMHSYLNGDVMTYDSYFSDDYHFIGSTDNEEFLNRKDTTQFFKETAEQFSGKTDLRKQTTTIEAFDDLIFITHLFDAWFINGTDWTYYGRFRFTSVLQEKKEGWKFIYQHFSIADGKTDEGETIGFDKVNEENQELREAIKRRTVELEQKNWELEIETALEKVRSRTMAMQHSDELQETSYLLDQQVRALGVKTWGCAFNIYGEKDSSEWFGNEAGILPTYTVPRAGIFKEYYQKGQKGESLYIQEFSGKACVDHYEYMSSLPIIGDVLKNLKKTNNGFPTYQIDHVVYFKYGYLLFITKEDVPEAHDVFKRFAKVFEQTYTRFLDLQKAEAQAKEAKIETALERVRTSGMAMHKSEELKDVVKEIFDQMAQLKINADHAGIVVDYKPKKDFHFWVADNQDIASKVTVPCLDLPWNNQFAEAKNKGKDFFTTQLNFEEKNSFYNKLLPHIDGLTEEVHDFYLNCPGLAISTVLKKDIGLYIENFNGIPFLDEENAILMRFGKVFQQTYTRFLDLQKAEAQAREAQIEAALEKVRSRTMAMQHSDELPEVANRLFLQVQGLGIPAWSCGFNILSEDKTTSQSWMSSEGVLQKPFNLEFKKEVSFIEMYNFFKSDKSFLLQELDGKAIENHYKYLKSLPGLDSVFGDLETKEIPLPTYQINHLCKFNFGYLLFITYEKVPESHDIFKRFTKVFEQTYTRFLDLQKAEAQARESEIELALERIRARTMAMQKSEEIGDVAFILFQQLKSLGGNLWGTGFGFCKENSDIDEYWLANEKGVMPHLKVPNKIDSTHKQMYQGWKKNLKLLSIEKGGKELKAHYKYMLSVPDLQPIFQGILDDGIAFPEWQKWHAAYFKYGYLLVITTDIYENEEVLIRFAKVFEQTYTRFLDLQKAEEQAKEAQIETALERIRSRSMAMQKSSELLEAGELLWNEITKLGIDCFTSGYVLMDDMEDIGWNYTPNPSTGKILEQAIGIPHKQTPPMRKIVAKWKKQEPLCVIELTRKQTIAHQTFVAEKGINFPFSAKELIEISPKEIVIHTFNFKQGYLLIIGDEKLAKTQIDVMLRFTKVFQQTYTRFLDLKKAEAQTREAKIEAALERTRTQSMLMQHSDELNVTAQVFHQQLQLLGFDSEFSYLWLPDDEEKTHKFWATWSDNKKDKTIYNNKTVSYPLDKNEPSIAACYVAWESEETVHVNFVEPNKVEDYFNTWSELLSGVDKFKPELFPNGLYYVDAYMDYGCFGIMIKRQLDEAEKSILSRFSKEFQRTYTRFLDLQKAEEQAREAQIEAALEKVRSRTMAMQKGEELQDVVVLLYKELIALGVTNFATCGYVEINEETNLQSTWVTNPGGDSLGLFYLPLTGDVHFDARYEAWKNKQTVFHQTVAGIERRKHLEYAITTFNSKEAEEMVLNQFPDPTVFYCFNFSHGYLHLVAGSQLTEDEETLLARFTRVFEQTYARFLDLKKAEAQAREAEIENALEKVRSRTMAMQNSEELLDVISVVSEQLQQLEFKFVHVSFANNDISQNYKFWTASKNRPKPMRFSTPYKDIPVFNNLKKAQEQSASFCTDILTKKEHNQWHKHLLKHGGSKIFSKEENEYIMSRGMARSVSINPNIMLLLANYASIPYSEDENKIIARFGQVFEQSYTRFLDLKKAEAQARESQIENALEKVRSRTMAMQHSDELPEAANNLFLQVQELGIPAWSAGYCIWGKDQKSALCHMSSEGTIQKGFSLPTIGEGYNFYDPYKNGETFHVSECGGKNLVKHYDFMKTLPTVGEIFEELEKAGLSLPTFQIFHIVYFKFGYVMFITYESVPDAHHIFKRFGQVFEQTYTRFLDLKKAEAQTREAQIEAALERVRARALAMHNPEELKDVARVLRTEMGRLGIEELETSSIYILDNQADKAECWYAIKDNQSKDKKLISDHISIDFTKTWVGQQMLKFHGSEDETTSVVMTGKERIEWIRYCENLSKKLKSYYGEDIPDRTYHLHKFSNGAIGAASAGEISQESWMLLKRCASVFSLAYSRFKDLTQAKTDLKRLKTEKKRAEYALSELQTTQKQLIQSEKMASLGELTAGIAHEIQNPLNFVNNFSEVSKELLDEMQEEIENGDFEEVKAIMIDVIQNLEKINHHGKRADGIVKGMLQHSRASGDKKEPTDINVLADEYLRLAYHGLRAKDKSFNAELVTDFDDSIESVMVVPQDVGRVILNLLTNAFYVVNEKKKTNIIEYKPRVSISTKKMKRYVEITVTDNGKGIPDAVKEKIFQPFFTTKPTGKGTGLGLSLSYDIITKGHGGDIKVKTKEGEGTTFIIHLPLEK